MIKAQVTYILVILLGNFLYGEPLEAFNEHASKVDSLVNAVRQKKETDISEARRSLQELKALRKVDGEVHASIILLLEGELLLQEDKLTLALEKITEANQIFESTENWNGVIDVNDVLSSYYALTAMYPEALEYAFKSIEIKEEIGDKLGLARSLIDVADIYWYYNRFDDGIKYSQRAIDLIESDGPSDQLAMAYKLLSECYLELPEYEKALEFIDLAIEMKRLLGQEEIELASARNSRGNVLKYLKRYDEAVAEYSDVLQTCEDANLRIGIRATSANLGHVLLLKGEFEQAIEYKLKSLEIQLSSGQDQQVAENVLHLSDAYAGLRDFENAYKYRLWYDSITAQEHAQALDKLTNELGLQYETEKKEQAIEGLEAKLSLQRLSILLGAGILAISLVAILIFLRLNRQLKSRNHENEILLREIHHRVKNNLQILSSLLSLQADHLIDGSAINAIIEGKNRVESMGMIHQHLYRDAGISSVDMKEYISELCRYLESSFSVSEKDITISEDIKFGEMDVDYAIPLGLIINELVTNAVKYAFPNQARGQLIVELERKDGALHLQVSDNGTANIVASESVITASFGSMMIETLSKKLKGVVAIDLDRGYRTSITFARF